MTAFPFQPGTILAPMEGVTHPAMRALIAEKGGLGLVCTEFVRISRSDLSPKHLRRQVVRAAGVALCVQVMGNEVEKMAEAAAVVSGAGADVVDLNLGCPAPRVVRHGVGAAMLKDRALLREVLEAMRRSVPGLLSAKIRAGFDNKDDVVDIARAVEAAGVDYLVIHPRTRSDFYTGVADWRTIKLIKESVGIPVVGNGDCWYAEDAFRMRAETGADAVMIGRPALRNPWIFQQIHELAQGRAPFVPSGKDVFRWLEGVTTRFREEFRPNDPLGKIKELIQYLGRAVEPPEFRRRALRLERLDDVLALAEEFLVDRRDTLLDLGTSGTIEKSGHV